MVSLIDYTWHLTPCDPLGVNPRFHFEAVKPVGPDVLNTTFPTWNVESYLRTEDSPQHGMVVPQRFWSQRDHDNAQVILQRAWLLAVEFDLTFVVISNGNSERIGMRDRATQTLFLSQFIHLSEEKEYMKSHVGLYLAAWEEHFQRDRAEQIRVANESRHPSPSLFGTAEQVLQRVNEIPFRLFGGQPVYTWSRCQDSGDIHHLELESMSSYKSPPAKRMKLSNRSPSIPDGKPYLSFDLSAKGAGSSFTFEGALFVNDERIRSNLAAKILCGQASAPLCKEYSKYKELMDAQVEGMLRHHGVFSCFDTAGRPMAALLVDDPGESLKVYEPTLRAVHR
ncbi:hypothetical protein BDN72DRAFT_141317 [Pluteus cervinus]|uniref:Uncharacterized protein n=1 Tax=Pluteus cervinus TaxID=181527 RepID=A0ACD3ALQ0_9AGAR|nr:hypothetical protein BDN72DRAFT_141317 [Pluteus cervinus]